MIACTAAFQAARAKLGHIRPNLTPPGCLLSKQNSLAVGATFTCGTVCSLSVCQASVQGYKITSKICKDFSNLRGVTMLNCMQQHLFILRLT